ncbi:class I adenylate-forming enzyme family protein [Streptomyces sp. NPDC058740]|uniref:class I adenylate-forming enzyme family protein n=1 Tax=unclassified Streptomyces TaxID=2593676 RepID=UPI0036AC1E8A
MPSPSLAQNIAAHAERQPSATALVLNDQHTTYGELAGLVALWSERLSAADLPADRPVCIPARKDPATVALMLAAFARPLVVLAPSPELGEDALDRICRQARVSARLSASPDGTLDVLAHAEDAAAAAGFGRPTADTARLLLTTSGSTGTPKLVPIGTEAFDAFAAWAAREFRITSADASLSYAPLNFDLALLDVWTFLGAGARVVLVDREKATDAPHLRRLVSDGAVTFVQGVPLLYRLLTEGEGAFEAVREVVLTGDAVPQDLLARAAESFPRARFHNVYGCTETNDSFLHPVDPRTAPGKIPIGRPLPGVEATVLDDEGNALTGPGTGELVVRTPFQTTGYLQESLNPDVFVLREGRVFYRTGDIVTRDADGLHHLEGRSDWQVKVRGVRTNLQEVESVLAQHPDVEEAAVVALPDPEAGVRLHARLTKRAGAGLNSLAIRSYAGANLPRHAIPSSVRISEIPLPRTSTGKPDRNKIKEEISA